VRENEKRGRSSGRRELQITEAAGGDKNKMGNFQSVVWATDDNEDVRYGATAPPPKQHVIFIFFFFVYSFRNR